MKSVTIKLTKKQREQVESLCDGASFDGEPWGIFGQGYVEAAPLAHKAGTATFYYCPGDQFKVINKALTRAARLPTPEPGSEKGSE